MVTNCLNFSHKQLENLGRSFVLSEELHGPFKGLYICVGSLSFGVFETKIGKVIPALC